MKHFLLKYFLHYFFGTELNNSLTLFNNIFIIMFFEKKVFNFTKCLALKRNFKKL